MWYLNLNKLWFQPPGWVFAPVWTFLYVLMGISLFLVWKRGWRKHKTAISLFGLQLALNFAWSFLFFSGQSLVYSSVEIVALLVVLLLVTKRFYSISKKAAYLLIPYVAWVSFATILTLTLFLLN